MGEILADAPVRLKIEFAMLLALSIASMLTAVASYGGSF